MCVSSDKVVVGFSCNKSCVVCYDEATSSVTDGVCFLSTVASFETCVCICSAGAVVGNSVLHWLISAMMRQIAGNW